MPDVDGSTVGSDAPGASDAADAATESGEVPVEAGSDAGSAHDDASDGASRVDAVSRVDAAPEAAYDAAPEAATPDATPIRDAAPDTSGNATDAQVTRYPLVIGLTGSGHGAVTSNVGGIQCGVSCSAQFNAGTSVTLTATPDPGLIFVGWSIPECPGAGTCTIVMNASRSIVARFFRPVAFSNVDKSPDVSLSPDGLGMQQFTLGRQGVRSDRAIQPGSGIFYFEAERKVAAPFIELGVATATVPLDSNLGDTDQTYGVDTGGIVTGGANLVGQFDPASNSHFGFIVDYRQVHPYVALVMNDLGTPKVAFGTVLANVTAPLYIFAGGLRQNIGIQSTINPGNDTTNFPFFYDAKALMRAAGVAGADQIVLGFGDSYAGVFDTPPTIQVSVDQTVALGSAVTVSATATDREDGDLTARIAWADLATPLGARTAATGRTFSLVPNALGVHELLATVTDKNDKTVTASVHVNVTGTLPVANPVRLETDATSGTGIQLSSDGLSARFTDPAKLGIRANQGLLHGFQYFEIHRLIAPMNMGGGLVIKNGNLNPYGPLDVPPSCSVNVLGGTWHSLMFHKNFPDGFATEEYYGFAVDYRGAHPIVYVVVRSQVVDTIALDDVTVPIYPMLYGNPTVTPSGPAMTINFGATPFHNDARAALVAATVDVTGLKLGWGGGP